MRTLLSCLAVLTLAIAACSDDADDAATTTTTTSTTSTTDPSTTSTTPPSGPVLVPLEQSCQAPGGFSISYPADWDAVSDCGQFGPAPVEEPAPATDERPGVVSVYVDRVPFSEASGPVQGEQSRATTTVDGLQAVRVESESTGEGLYPAGTAAVTWMVDLAIGPDDGPGTLFLNAVDVLDDVDFEQAVATMDRMARTLEIGVGDTPENDQVIARYEGGGTPATVAAAPSASAPATCLRLLELDGIACVEAVEAAAGVALTGLDGPAGSFTVGITGPDVFAVDLDGGGENVTFLPVPYPGRDSRAFAVPVDVGQLESVTLRSIDGTVLAEVGPKEAQRPADG